MLKIALRDFGTPKALLPWVLKSELVKPRPLEAAPQFKILTKEAHIELYNQK